MCMSATADTLAVSSINQILEQSPSIWTSVRRTGATDRGVRPSSGVDIEACVQTSAFTCVSLSMNTWMQRQLFSYTRVDSASVSGRCQLLRAQAVTNCLRGKVTVLGDWTITCSARMPAVVTPTMGRKYSQTDACKKTCLRRVHAPSCVVMTTGLRYVFIYLFI